MSNASVLVYDGDCGICKEWVDYWQSLTGHRVDYRPYQEVADQYEGISLESFQQSIQLIEPDGTVSSGAKATYMLYRGIHPYSILSFLYKYLPGFGLLSETGYRFFSGHRGLLAFITHLFWGRHFRPPEYSLVTRIFLIALGLIYFSAFFSFLMQAQGLIGSHGILPLHYYLDRLTEYYGDWAWLNAPMIFWFNASNPVIQFTCIAGCLVALLLIFNVLRESALILLYILYLSLYYAGQTFMTFQWDILLLEAGFLAIFIGQGSRIIVWLYRWLVFRFIFLGGLVKLLSRDPAWDSLTALNYHFETQPLPTPLAWYAHQLPESLLMTLVAITLFVELVVPFFIFSTRRFRFIAAWLIIIFQTGIILTGNYNFFNLLTISMCVFLFDDAAISRCYPSRLMTPAVSGMLTQLNAGFFLRSILALVIIYTSSEKLAPYVWPGINNEFSVITRVISPFNIVNNYGPFAIMTTERNEIIVEGSSDGINWQEYRFRYKPGELDKPLRWIIPHQPRVDWQMWFAALSNPDRQIWFKRLLYQCLEGEREVLKLFEYNPFKGSPPKYIRAQMYRYEFTSADERAQTGHIWKRSFIKVYFPAIYLQS